MNVYQCRHFIETKSTTETIYGWLLMISIGRAMADVRSSIDLRLVRSVAISLSLSEHAMSRHSSDHALTQFGDAEIGFEILLRYVYCLVTSMPVESGDGRAWLIGDDLVRCRHLVRHVAPCWLMLMIL